MRKQILMLLDNAFTSDARVEKEAITLVKGGYNVAIVCMKQTDTESTEIKNQYTIHRLLDATFKSPFKAVYKAYVQAIAERLALFHFDFLHCHDYHMLILGNEIKKIKPETILIYDSHEYLAGFPLYKSSEGLLNKLKGYLVWRWLLIKEKKAIKKVDGILTPGKYIAEFIKKDFNFKGPVDYLQNIPEKFAISTQKYFHLKYGIHFDSKIVIHTGNIYFEPKDFLLFIEAVAQIKNLFLVFMIDTDKGAFYNALVKSSGYESKIFFHDYIKTPEIGTYISAADIGYIYVKMRWKSQLYSCPNRLMEYSMAGLPVISNPLPESINLNKKFNHIVFYHSNAIKIIKTALYKTLEKLEILKQNALKSRAELSWDSEAKKLINFYNNL